MDCLWLVFGLRRWVLSAYMIDSYRQLHLICSYPVLGLLLSPASNSYLSTSPPHYYLNLPSCIPTLIRVTKPRSKSHSGY